MSRRKRHKAPVEFSAKLHRYLGFCRDAAWEMSNSPWLRNHPDTLAAFREMFHLVCKCQNIHSEHHGIILETSREA